MASIGNKTLKTQAAKIEAELKAEGVPYLSNVKAVKAALQLTSIRSVHRAIERGELVAFKVGNRWRVRRSALAEFIAKAERAAS